MYRRPLRILLALGLPALLAACGTADQSDENLDSLDAELTDANAQAAPAKDPALMSALQSQIMVDPNLAQQSNADAVRPAGQPYSSPIPPDGIAQADGTGAKTGPLMRAPAAKDDCPECKKAEDTVTLGALAARQANRRASECVGQLRYSANWANRLPRDLPLYPDARLDEAAGNDQNGCALRAVSFTANAGWQAVVDWYYTRAMGGGYKAEHQADGAIHVIGGTRGDDAFMVYVTPRDGGGVEVDVIANNGV